MEAFLAYLASAGAVLKALPWYAVALPLVAVICGCGGCVTGCSCERARLKEPTPEVRQTHVLTINGKDVVYDRTPEGWRAR